MGMSKQFTAPHGVVPSPPSPNAVRRIDGRIGPGAQIGPSAPERDQVAAQSQDGPGILALVGDVLWVRHLVVLQRGI